MVATCEKCFWREQCAQSEVCEHFTPLEECDEIIDVIIEEKRYEFYEEWFDLIDQADE